MAPCKHIVGHLIPLPELIWFGVPPCWPAAAVREAVRGRADEEQSRLVALRPLDAWGDVWHALTRLQDETERFNLDKRQAVVAGLGMLSGTMP